MQDKLLIVNVKHYRNAVGKNIESFVRSCPEKLSDGWSLVFAIGTYDSDIIHRLSNRKFMSQHVDGNEFGAFTGKVSVELLKEKGFVGSLLNHSENRVGQEQIRATITSARRSSFPVIVCLENLDEIKKIANFRPDYIAYEPKELIGGDISVSTAKPDVITHAAEICHSAGIGLIVGAGVKNRRDVVRSLELGATGVLVASGIVLAKDPAEVIKALTAE